MPILTIILVLFAVGFVCWAIQSAPIPVHPWFKTLIIGIIAIATLFWFVNVAFGVGPTLRLR